MSQINTQYKRGDIVEFLWPTEEGTLFGILLKSRYNEDWEEDEWSILCQTHEYTVPTRGIVQNITLESTTFASV